MNKNFVRMHICQRLKADSFILRILVFLMLGNTVFIGRAQNTVSPYSVFGPGELQNRGFGVNRGMGGAGIALKSGNYINSLNPASYAGLDSLRIIAECGLSAKSYKLSSKKDDRNGFTGNLGYIGLGFRYTPWMAGSIGVVPFSEVKYTIESTNNYVDGTETQYNTTYDGSGGISQFYFGNAVSVFKNLLLGVNFSYMFGSLKQNENFSGSAVPAIQISRYDYLNSLYFDFGLQYAVKIKETTFSFGATYAPKQYLRSKHVVEVYNSSQSLISETEDRKSKNLRVPHIAGIGLGMEVPRKYRIAIDYTLQKWSGIEYPTQDDGFVDLHKFAVGMEMHPWRYSMAQAAYKNWTYRAGIDLMRSYLKIGSHNIYKGSFTLGVGVPLTGKLSNINFSITGGREGTTTDNLVKEKFLIFNLGFNFNEIAFVHRKFD